MPLTTGLDTLTGTTGDDVFLAPNGGLTAGDSVSGGTGTDIIRLSEAGMMNASSATLISIERLEGSSGSDTIVGSSNGEIVDGGLGADVLIGWTGDDIYIVDNIGDMVIEFPGDGIDEVRTSVAFAMPDNVERMTLTGTADLNLTGNSAGNVLTGNAGSNIIDGGAGADSMSGGGGNDVYIVDDAGDLVIENAGEGTDEVRSSVSFALPANVENLVLTGTGNINATGNSASNTLTGNSGGNTLDGGAGADTMAGGGGDDTYIVDDAGDIVTENANEGNDTVRAALSYTLGTNVENLVLTGTGNTNATGNSASNSLTGNSGNNTLDGGTGADTMAGGGGDDLYIVDNVGDIVTEAAGEGTDTVRSSVTYALGGNIEHLILTGSAAINGTGNALTNAITGNSAANILDGGAGADRLLGGAGDDIYIVDDAGDVVTESLNEGTDEVRAGISYTLGANLERLTLTGTGNLNATGNSLNNVLAGNMGNNTLDGGTGADSMSGGAGNDIYIVENAGDTVTEAVAEGTDEVRSSVTFVLGANIENLVLTGGGVINATGNSLNNVLTGNSASNAIDGGAGADTMSGGAGDDVYTVDSSGDSVIEAANEGSDTVRSSVSFTLGANVEHLVLTGSTAINGTGNSVANSITGNAAANTLDGAGGADTLIGGQGDDVYIVDNASDVATELTNQGWDWVQASLNWTLGANLEGLVLTGTASLNGTGNDLGNALNGNAGANTLDGQGGVDQMAGGTGDDIYIVENAGDIVLENANEGTDEIRASVSFTLVSNVERLTLTGSGAINGYGNALDNILLGNGAANLIDGGIGNDRLTGGGGHDSFVYTSGSDVITDFAAGGSDDTIDLRAFTSLTTFASVMALAAQSGANTVITLSPGNSLTLDSVLRDALTEADFILAPSAQPTYGTSSANSMQGTAGPDIIDALAGNDVIDGKGGGDTLLGGEGDDTIYFYWSDGLTGSNGGTGTDTLFVVGGSAPTGFNLAAQGFEIARHDETDTSNITTWATNTNLYNSAWQLTSSNRVNDDGTRVAATYDRGLLTWAIAVDEFNVQGGRDIQRIYNDDGSYRFFYWDVTNSTTWATFDDEFDAQGRRYVERITNDDGSLRYFYWDVSNGQTWSSFDEEYNSAQQRIVQRVANDDGSGSQQYWDPANAQSWSSIIEYTNTSGQRISQHVTNDNGTTVRVTYDAANTQPWATRSQTYSAAGILLSDVTTPD